MAPCLRACRPPRIPFGSCRLLMLAQPCEGGPTKKYLRRCGGVGQALRQMCRGNACGFWFAIRLELPPAFSCLATHDWVFDLLGLPASNILCAVPRGAGRRELFVPGCSRLKDIRHFRVGGNRTSPSSLQLFRIRPKLTSVSRPQMLRTWQSAYSSQHSRREEMRTLRMYRRLHRQLIIHC